MKARLLKKLVQADGYNVSHREEYMCIGNGYVHDLISVDKKTLKVKYALDTFHEGRGAIKDKALEFIWDKLHELIVSGRMREIIDGQDEIENPITVYTIEDGKLVEKLTDAIGYPNVTIDGDQMYDNSHYKTREEAIEYGIKECEGGIKTWLNCIQRIKDELKEKEAFLAKEEGDLAYLKNLKSLVI